MDISQSLAPKSDQLDAIELVGGPRTFTIDHVSLGSDEQPLDIHLRDFPRVWRPSKGMRRVLAAGWGTDASKWVGGSVTLYFDPNVSFGKEKTGGTRISHMTGLPGNKRLTVPMTITRGKSTTFTVEPLPEPAPAISEPSADQVAASTNQTELRAWWKVSGSERQAQIRARVEQLNNPTPADDDRSDEAASLFADQT